MHLACAASQQVRCISRPIPLLSALLELSCYHGRLVHCGCLCLYLSGISLGAHWSITTASYPLCLGTHRGHHEIRLQFHQRVSRTLVACCSGSRVLVPMARVVIQCLCTSDCRPIDFPSIAIWLVHVYCMLPCTLLACPSCTA